MKKITALIAFLLLFAVSPGLKAQFIVADPQAQAERIAQGIKNAAAAKAQITQLITMTKWIANTWSQASEGIKAFHKTKEFWDKSGLILNYMGNVQGWMARDENLIKRSFRDRAQTTSKDVALTLKDAYNDVQMAATSTRLDFAKRVELVNAGIVKLDYAIFLIRSVNNAAEIDYIENGMIKDKKQMYDAVYDAYKTK